jgi:hypothetical protein
MKIIAASILMFMILSNTTAQHKINFSSQNYVGLLEGEQGSKFQLQTVNGIKYKTWFFGLGTGLDWYYLRSIPAFLSINKDFYKKGNRNFFVAADGGINFPWKDDKQEAQMQYQFGKLVNGPYWAAGFGYKIGIGKKNDAVLLQIAYSYKYIGEKIKPTYFYTDVTYPITNPQQQEYDQQYDYHLRRLSLKIGWNF